MLRFLLQKLIHKKWMVFSLLIGNILLIAVTVSHPMYREASLNRMLTDEFSQYMEENAVYPGVITIRTTRKPDSVDIFNNLDSFAENISSYLEIELLENIKVFQQTASDAVNLGVRNDTDEFKVQISAMTDFEKHIQMVSGELYQERFDGVIEAVVSESAFVEMNLLIGDEIQMKRTKGTDGEPLTLRITGVFTYADDTDAYWVKSPDAYNTALFIDYNTFSELYFQEHNEKLMVLASWYALLDYSAVYPSQVNSMQDRTASLVKEVTSLGGSITSPAYLEILSSYQGKEKRVSVTLMVLQIPILVLLCAFLFMISGQMLSMEQNEISILKSRGAGGTQIFGLYFLQSVLLSGVSLIIGLPLGAFLCQVLGSSNAFLEFVQRRFLAVSVNAEVFAYAFGAMAVSVLVTVIPALRYSRISIVNLKQKKSRSRKPMWQRLYLDIIVLGISLYGWYVFSLQKEEMAAKVLSGSSLDPLLYFSSSLFILGAGLLALRLAPFFVKGIFLIGKRKWKPETYASFLQLLRTGSKQFFIMEFLMLTLALGIFNATVARTILSNAENNTRYQIGADLVMQEVWPSNELLVKIDPSVELVYTEPDFSKYSQIEGVNQIARVFTADGTDRNGTPTAIMGIVTNEFGKTASLPEGLNSYTFVQYLNVLSTNADAVLVSRSFHNEYGYQLGDSIAYTISGKDTITGVIYGFFDYFPGYIASTTKVLPDGSAETSSCFMIVAHLNTIQENWDVTPYELWFDLEPEGADNLYAYLEETNTKVSKFEELESEVRAIRNDTLFQGTNGILTMSFIVILILCCAGFLIYWILSIRSRELLFGVFRAMGMSRNGILKMLLNEQIFSSLLFILIGAGIGIIASRLYVPLIQIAYAAEKQALPLELITNFSDMVRLFAVIGVVLVICMFILAKLVFGMKITNALKLGED